MGNPTSSRGHREGIPVNGDSTKQRCLIGVGPHQVDRGPPSYGCSTTMRRMARTMTTMRRPRTRTRTMTRTRTWNLRSSRSIVVFSKSKRDHFEEIEKIGDAIDEESTRQLVFERSACSLHRLSTDVETVAILKVYKQQARYVRWNGPKRGEER